ncbi:hypothetical protein N658DRAFT_518291 [Parathielavia hyrcaniae]|uniref:Uncharacterized protein n=1 Tax=Parathielavia hyrcaniae TaxID=113614 RepID=A0AAN6PYY6_9PEZI|nr:hypothetical protein N658DRAFT_518291 [Parathielavia hyrcaniae]
MVGTTLLGTPGSVAPAAVFFRPAWPAVSGHVNWTPLWNRGAEEVCNSVGGSFFCCPEGAGSVGCIRACAAGDFQCGSVCCADGQTCMGGDTLSPYCVNQGSTGAVARLTSAFLQTTTISSTSPSFPTSSMPASASINATPSPTSTLADAHTTATATLSEAVTASAAPQHGLSRAAQISIGVIVPVVVVFLVGALWFFISRRRGVGLARGHRRGEAVTSSGDAQVDDKVWLDGAAGPSRSLHGRYMLKSNAGPRRVGQGEGYETKDPRELEDAGVHGQDATDSGSGGRASPHPGTPVIV